MAQLFAGTHDLTGPLIDNEFPTPTECEPKGKLSRTSSDVMHGLRTYINWRWFKTLGVSFLLVCGAIVVLNAFKNYLRQTQERTSAVEVEPSWGQAHAQLYEYGASYTLSSPRELPQSFDAWTDLDYVREFNVFRKRFDRSYAFGSAEFSHRFDIFKRNVDYIHSHNIARNTSFKLAPNQFADVTPDDWAAIHLNTRSRATNSEPVRQPLLWHLMKMHNSTIPPEVNWHTRGCVTPVKNQLKCGSCWAFSATGAIEGAICARTGKLFNLSEQQLVDCADSRGAHGCHGGYMDDAFKYVIDAGGLCTEEDYPYHAKEQKCQHNCHRVAQIATMADIPSRNDKAMRAALAFHGPVAAGIEADKSSFQFYHTGILDLSCGKHLNHAILIVGYGHDSKTQEAFWYVKNSWGSTWGDGGYIRLGRKHHGSKGECGILLTPTIPIIHEHHYNDHFSHLQ